MSVEIDPQELSFRRPFTVEVTQVLKIKNPNVAPVAFKVKTTAPKQYCVRPNSGRIEPGHDVEVSVLLQAMKQEPSPDARCKDKFLVQSVTITGDNEFTNVSQIWDFVEKGSVQERKIRVNWLSGSEEAPEVMSTPARRSLANGTEATPEPPRFSSPREEHVADVSATCEPDLQRHDSAPSSSYSTQVATSIKTAAGEVYDEVKQQAIKAEDAIGSLGQEASRGLRQRKATAATEGKAAATSDNVVQAVRQGTEGVPVQIAAVLCLVSFLLAYFFF